MSLFFGGEKKEAVLFSPLEGKLTLNGKSASGAKITLWLAWKDKEGEYHHFSADEAGHFSIPAQIAIYKESPLLQISIGQTITVDYEGREYLIWRAGKTTTTLYGELGGRPKNVTCELSDPEMNPYLEHALLETLCKWEKLDMDAVN